MASQVSIPADETALLTPLIGSRGLRVEGDEFGVVCRTDRGEIVIAPRDEAGEAAPGKPEEVIRVAIGPQHSPSTPPADKVDVILDAPITRVAILRTAVWFGAPRRVEATEILGAVIPSGIHSDVHVGHPASAPPDETFNPAGKNVVDSAICFYFAWGGPLVIGTDGWSYRLAVESDSNATEWIANAQEVPLND